jgi:D-sedoheptulose 7-phosphate isomerase
MITSVLALVCRRVADHQQVIDTIRHQIPAIAAAGHVLLKACRAGRQAIFFGNGGSAADAQHLAAELVGRFAFDRPALPAIALTVNTSILTAIANDYGYDRVFARQIEALGRRGDVAVGLSTSGNAANVVEGLRAARRKGLVTIGMTGAGGGRVNRVADFCIRVQSDATPRIQEMHILIGHIWCELVEDALFGKRAIRSRRSRRPT